MQQIQPLAIAFTIAATLPPGPSRDSQAETAFEQAHKTDRGHVTEITEGETRTREFHWEHGSDHLDVVFRHGPDGSRLTVSCDLSDGADASPEGETEES